MRANCHLVVTPSYYKASLCCQVRRTRATQRAGRRRAGKPLCSIVGYTNAGKSSLVSALSGSYVEAEDRYS